MGTSKIPSRPNGTRLTPMNVQPRLRPGQPARDPHRRNTSKDSRLVRGSKVNPFIHRAHEPLLSPWREADRGKGRKASRPSVCYGQASCPEKHFTLKCANWQRLLLCIPCTPSPHWGCSGGVSDVGNKEAMFSFAALHLQTDLNPLKDTH